MCKVDKSLARLTQKRETIQITDIRDEGRHHYRPHGNKENYGNTVNKKVGNSDGRTHSQKDKNHRNSMEKKKI